MIDISKVEYKETSGIPLCPYCQKATTREGSVSMSTLVYYPPVYDKRGNNTNPDRNTTRSGWRCLKCKNVYSTVGNPHDGYKYL